MEVHLAPEAIQDLKEIQNHLYQSSKDFTIANNFTVSLYDTLLESLPNFPEKHPVYYNNIRKFVFPKFPNYCAYFEVLISAGQIRVYAITPTAQFTRYSNL